MNREIPPPSPEKPGGEGVFTPLIRSAEKAGDRISIGQAFEMHLQRLTAKEYSPHTLRGMRHMIQVFYHLSGLGPASPLTEVTRAAAEKVLTKLPGSYSPGTAWSYRGKFLGIFRALAADGLILENPFLTFEMPRAPKLLPGPVLTKEEVVRLLEVPRLDLPSGVRNRAILEVLYATGMRLSECAHLGVGDVDLGRGTVAIRSGKGAKDRVVPLGKSAVKWLRRYLKHVRPRFAASTSSLWVGQEGRPIAPLWIQRLVRRLGRRAGIEVPVTPNTLRRSCATHLLSAGATLWVVRDLLGHTDLKTLSRYVRLEVPEVKETHEKTHPRS